MAETTGSVVRIQDFPGLALEVDLLDLKEGASHNQVNATSEQIGVLQSRKGYRVVTFDATSVIG